nr:DNA/RNA nuclease SfsA [Gemmatimonadota bacterium]NIU22726.1 DNA/RNA nuclease SfsA [Actinomycetota bacterium]NIU80193.1 DNA/RNA nuclease SfsA [Gammaproteobacteria bacterium]NIV90938.1 DNA/RNA nuclease SfsA [Actinomycetota bacterium]NIX23930.1 DNA/RNA nuclease SfsA [Actinomycetota bacterium]
LREAIAAGVEAVAYRARMGADAVALEAPVPVVCA